MKAVTIRGVTYASMRHAAKALGVTPQTVSAAAKAGTLEGVGLGPLKHGCAPRYTRATVIEGVAYPSRTAPAEALGVTRTQISHYLKVRSAVEERNKIGDTVSLKTR